MAVQSMVIYVAARQRQFATREEVGLAREDAVYSDTDIRRQNGQGQHLHVMKTGVRGEVFEVM